MTSQEQIAQWISAPEGAQLEFKTAENNYQFDKLVEYCVALANEGGGKIILGVTDKRPRSIVGTKAFDEPGRTEAGLHTRLGHDIPVEETSYQGKRLLIVHVPGRLPGAPWQDKGRYLRRSGDGLIPMIDVDLRKIYAEVDPDYSAQTCNATFADLSPVAIGDFRQRWSRKASNPRIAECTDEQLLTDAELLVDAKPNIAALILFGTREALGRHIGQAEIIFEYRSSEASGPAQDRIEFREGFFLCYDELWQRINLRNDLQSYQEGLFRYDIPTFDEVAVREALLNAFAHRDYRLGGSIFLRQFARRLEVISPGGFPLGITPENILDQQNPRNRRLAEALARCGLIERSGQGMNLMVESAIRQSKPLPSFDGSSSHEIRLTLQGTIQDPAFVRFLERIDEEQLRSFSTHDFLALDTLRRDQQLTDSQRARLPILVDAGVVETQGRGRGIRYMLSRGLYSAIGKKGVYTRKQGLDHETNKELLVKHIRDNDNDGSPLQDLKQVLPALSISQVQTLLHQLRYEGRVQLRGQKRWARWYSVSAKALEIDTTS
jgi:ATP-dependent DNA helicase RecG